MSNRFGKFLALASIALLGSLASFQTSAAKFGSFLGAWQGTDPNDGGLQTWFISPSGNLGIYQVRVHDTYIRTCEGKRGSFLGEGRMNRGALIAELEIQCFSDPDNDPIGDPVPVTFTIESGLGGTLEAASEGLQLPTTLFRISK